MGRDQTEEMPHWLIERYDPACNIFCDELIKKERAKCSPKVPSSEVSGLGHYWLVAPFLVLWFALLKEVRTGGTWLENGQSLTTTWTGPLIGETRRGPSLLLWRKLMQSM